MADLDPAREAQREATSRRLKAARWLAGSGRNGRGQLVALPAQDLAQHPLLVDNGITASRIEEIEQERIDARPMELEKIGMALGVGPDWFADSVAEPLSPDQVRAAAELLGPQLLSAAQALLRAREPRLPGTGGQDRPDASGEGGGV